MSNIHTHPAGADLQIRDNLAQQYSDVYTPAVLAALAAVFHAIPRTRGIFYPFILIFAARALGTLWNRGGRQKAWLALWTAANVGVYFLQAPVRALLKTFL